MEIHVHSIYIYHLSITKLYSQLANSLFDQFLFQDMFINRKDHLCPRFIDLNTIRPLKIQQFKIIKM